MQSTRTDVVARGRTSRICCLMAFTGLLVPGLEIAAGAQDSYFPANATINYSIQNNAIIGYASQIAFNNGTGGTSPTVNLVTAGSIGGYLYAGNSSTVNVSGGSIGSFLYAFNSSTVNVSGGSIGNSLIANDSSLINFSGGSIQYELYANDNSTVNVSGGSIGDSLIANDSSTFNLFGTGLSSTLVDPNYQDAYSEYTLSGILQDGTNITGESLFVENGTGAQVTYINSPTSVPETGSFALLGWLGLTGAVFLRRHGAH